MGVARGPYIHKICFLPKVHIQWSALQRRIMTGSTLVKLKQDSQLTDRILVLRTFEEVEQFDNVFGYTYTKTDEPWRMIRWQNVAQYVGGIEFRNYPAIRKYMDTRGLFDVLQWYYHIDVSSGCMWNSRLVVSITHAFKI